MIIPRCCLAALLALSLPAASVAGAEDLKAAALAVAKKARGTVVTIRVVLKRKINVTGGQTQEEELKSEVTGTLVDSSGLTVTSAASFDQTAAINAAFKRIGGERKYAMETELKEATLILEDNTELEAVVVLKDTDLDIAVIRPREKLPGPLPAVSLKLRRTVPQLLDSLIVPGRMGKFGNRAASLSVGTVKSVVKGPRTFCICESDVSSNLGCIAYGEDGEPLGMLVAKPPPDTGDNASPASTKDGDVTVSVNLTAILRPIDDVIEVVEQARQVKPDPVPIEELRKQFGLKKPDAKVP